MKNSSVIIKSTKYGITLILDELISFEELVKMMTEADIKKVSLEAANR